MSKIKLLGIAVIGLLLLNFGILAKMLFQKPDHHGPHGGPGGHGGPKMIIIEKLGFDKTQQEKYEVLIKDHRSKMDQLDAEIRVSKDQLYSLLKSNTPDQIAADSLIFQISDKQKQIERVNFDHFKDIKGICKPEQIKNFDALLEELSRLFAPGPPHK